MRDKITRDASDQYRSDQYRSDLGWKLSKNGGFTQQRLYWFITHVI